MECRRKTDRQGACLASPRTACANTPGADGRTPRKTDEVGLRGRPFLCRKSTARGAAACRWTVDFFALLLPAPRAAEAPFAPRSLLGETLRDRTRMFPGFGKQGPEPRKAGADLVCVYVTPSPVGRGRTQAESLSRVRV